jgi:hypothetical protein
MRALVTSTAIAIALITAGCGGDSTTAPSTPPAPSGAGAQASSGDNVPASQQPGGPEPGQPTYTALGSWWKQLPQDKRVSSASQFIDDNPKDCTGVVATDLERQTYVAFAYDYPQNTHVSDVMRDMCELLLH